jgi:EAL domain-containing protein (putative c-di-GMP-specific phosphodiesterase class I)
MSVDPQLIPEPAAQFPVDPPFTFAFQPIVDIVIREVVGWEALIRGPWGEPAWQVFNQVSAPNLHLFDQTARISAVALAGRLGIDKALHLNLLPQSLDSYPKSILATLEAAQEAGIPANRIVVEVPEVDIIHDRAHFAVLIKDARALGVRLAIDDFGATYASLTLLDDLEPDQIKLDMRLIRGVERGGARQAILRAIRRACYDLKIEVVAEGVETPNEYQFLVGQRVRLFQGYLFAKPAFEAFTPVNFPEPSAGEAPRPAARATSPRIAASRSKKRA